MQRFWDKVDKTTDCWNWTGALRKNGYGCVKYNGKTTSAHRIVWLLTYGQFPKTNVLHTCDNRKCVNPKHLFEGNQRDNMLDAINKKRASPPIRKTNLGLGIHNENTYKNWGCRCETCIKDASEKRQMRRMRL